MGFSTGDWKPHAKDAKGNNLALKGQYSPVWKKQKDGSWKVLWDEGPVRRLTNPTRRYNWSRQLRFRQTYIACTVIFLETMRSSSGLISLRLPIIFSLALLLPIAASSQAQNTQSNAATDVGNFHINSAPKSPADYVSITGKQRLDWFVVTTVGPKSLLGGIFSAAYGTATNQPKEYGPHWEGFGKRYGMRLTGVSTGNAMEAGLGAIWGEDPRYFHTAHQTFGGRVKNVIDLTFRAYGRDGQRHPAYARYIAIAGNNFLSNTWRASSENDASDAALRTAEGFGTRALSNAFSEFVTLVWNKHRHDSGPTSSTNP